MAIRNFNREKCNGCGTGLYQRRSFLLTYKQPGDLLVSEGRLAEHYQLVWSLVIDAVGDYLTPAGRRSRR